MQQFDIPCNLSKCAQYQFKTICTGDGLKSRKALNTNFMIILKICQPLDIKGMTARGTVGLCSVHIVQYAFPEFNDIMHTEKRKGGLTL